MCREILSMRLNTIHNLYFYYQFFEKIRNAISENRFQNFKSAWLPVLEKIPAPGNKPEEQESVIYPKIAFKSSSAVLIGFIPKLLTSTFNNIRADKSWKAWTNPNIFNSKIKQRRENCHSFLFKP